MNNDFINNELEKAKQNIRESEIKSVAKALTILNYLAMKNNFVSLKEISEDLELPKGTASGILKTLKQYNFVKGHSNGRYELGIHLFELGTNAQKNFVNVARPYLQKLATTVEETVNLGILHKSSVLLVDKFQPNYGFQIGAQVGTKMKPHCIALGKVLLAHLPDEKLDETIKNIEFTKFTENTITDPDIFREELDETLIRGYGIDNGELMADMICVSAPLFNGREENIAAISVSGLISSFKGEKFEFGKKQLLECAQTISKDLC